MLSKPADCFHVSNKPLIQRLALESETGLQGLFTNNYQALQLQETSLTIGGCFEALHLSAFSRIPGVNLEVKVKEEQHGPQSASESGS